MNTSSKHEPNGLGALLHQSMLSTVKKTDMSIVYLVFHNVRNTWCSTSPFPLVLFSVLYSSELVCFWQVQSFLSALKGCLSSFSLTPVEHKQSIAWLKASLQGFKNSQNLRSNAKQLAVLSACEFCPYVIWCGSIVLCNVTPRESLQAVARADRMKDNLWFTRKTFLVWRWHQRLPLGRYVLLTQNHMCNSSSL